MVTAAVRYRETAYDVAKRNLESAAARLSLNSDLVTLLSSNYRDLFLELPLRMDNGKLRMISAERLLHSNSRGPAIGFLYLREKPAPGLAEALAANATWTCATVGVPFGGACALLDCDAATLSEHEHEVLVRRFATRCHAVLGPYQDVVIAPDDETAEWLLDEYASMKGLTLAAVAGKSALLGGAAQIRKAQARAAALSFRETAQQAGRDLQDIRVAIYAEPATALDFVVEFTSIGCTVVAVTDGATGIADPNGISAAAVRDLDHCNAGSRATPAAVLSSACDVLVVAAAHCLLDATNAACVRAQMVVEAGALNITPSADAVLKQQHTTVLPDLLAASGLFIAAHCEWSANLEQRQLQPREIESDLERTLSRAVPTVFERAARDRSSLRAAAYAIAVERVARTERLRGI